MSFAPQAVKSITEFEHLDIAIVGAGLIGRLFGFHLVKDGHTVTIYERDARDKPSSSSYVAASMLAPLSEYPESDPLICTLARRSLRAWPGLLTELNVPHAFDGSVAVAHAQDLPLLTKFQSTLKGAGLKGVHELTAKELVELEPGLADRFSTGLLLQGEGWLDNRALLDALESRCGEISFECPVNPSDLRGDVVIDCRGADSDDPTLRGVRGEVVRMRAPEVQLKRPIRLMHPKYQLYISPRPNNVFVVGATQIESASRSAISVRSALELLSAAYTVHPGFAEAEILELGVGIRPAYPDNQPRVRWQKGCLSVNGLYRHGFLVAPAIIQDAIEEVRSLCRCSLTANQ